MKCRALFCLIFTSWSTVLPCSAVALLVNGGFEAGNLSGWKTSNQTGGSGDFFVSTPGTTTPASFNVTSPNSSGGSFYAVSDTNGPGAHALLQAFVIPTAPLSVMLTFQMFVNNWAGTPTTNAAGLDYLASPNQHARVDILSATATPLDTGTGVLRNLFIGADTGTSPHTYTSYSFDITSTVTTPGIYILRFAQVDNQGVLNQGVDNVSVELTIPEPSAILLVLCAGSTLCIRRRRKPQCTSDESSGSSKG